MIKRVVEISNPCRLYLEHRQLIIEQEGEQAGSVPIEDLGALILDNPQITCTQRMLRECWENNVAVVFSDEKHIPGGILLPLAGNTLHSRTLAMQAQIGESVKKRLWQDIIRAKIQAQGFVIKKVVGSETQLLQYLERVRSGDPENIEGQAARIYWNQLFGEDFRRDPTLEGINIWLNYGYALIRAAVARAICGSGLHPALGVHHHNQYDGFCLADDLMEPLRPMVDRKVFLMIKEDFSPKEFTKEHRHKLLEILLENLNCEGGSFPLFAALSKYTADVKRVMEKELKNPSIPKIDIV